ncbi:hypothetical protein OESDEN_01661 [Oesophagostomum dentatum]|uniref:Dymeclin n=1 Tax=Oesophagostomum dentatum TaxID=61180 RepID=A0A0B1TQG9_OESDE|nr:hypothetical protein OESDEN_01661 [Oesophagostomum dentatum]
MGGRISSETNIAENVPLQRLTGQEPISDNDPFWNTLLSFNLKIDDYDTAQARSFDESLNDFLQSLMYNTQTSGNFAAFIKVFLRRSTELKTSEQYEKWVHKNTLVSSVYWHAANCGLQLHKSGNKNHFLYQIPVKSIGIRSWS